MNTKNTTDYQAIVSVTYDEHGTTQWTLTTTVDGVVTRDRLTDIDGLNIEAARHYAERLLEETGYRITEWRGSYGAMEDLEGCGSSTKTHEFGRVWCVLFGAHDRHRDRTGRTWTD